jgi:hypothetical protein
VLELSRTKTGKITLVSVAGCLGYDVLATRMMTSRTMTSSATETQDRHQSQQQESQHIIT